MPNAWNIRVVKLNNLYTGVRELKSNFAYLIMINPGDKTFFIILILVLKQIFKFDVSNVLGHLDEAKFEAKLETYKLTKLEDLLSNFDLLFVNLVFVLLELWE